MNTWNKTLVVGLAAAAVAITAPAPAYAYVQPIGMNINQSYYLNTGSSITRVAVANQEIADIKVLGASAINVVAKKAGTTTLNVWTSNGMRQEYMVTVSNEDKGLAAVIEKAIDLPNVHVQMVEKRVLLRGTVQNQYEKELAYKIASLYVGENVVTKKEEGKINLAGSTDTAKTDANNEVSVDSSERVLNLLEMVNPDQINIEAMVIEINSDDAKKLGVEYKSPTGVEKDTDSGWNTVTNGSAGEFYAGETYGQQRSAGSHWYSSNWLFTHFSQINASIHALVTQGKARIISRPNITTMSGKSAGILVGGQIPYPSVSSTSNNISVEYKPYGISLILTNPTVDLDGNVTTKLEATVSRLDWTNQVSANGYSMPGLATRSAQTVVNIPSGMTMAIGGLLDSEDNKKVTKVPLLGNIPILGELFKYHNDTRQKSEIMILITPRVVNENTTVRMSEKMRDTYREGQDEVRDMPQVNVNEVVPAKKPVNPKTEPTTQEVKKPVNPIQSKVYTKSDVKPAISAEKTASEMAAAKPVEPAAKPVLPKAVEKPAVKPAVKPAASKTTAAEEYSLDHIVSPEQLQNH
jgi:pilus assembly protein CpaC